MTAPQTPRQPSRVPPTVPPYGFLADMYAQRALHRTAYSALPDAPVQPYVERRRNLRRVMIAISSTVRRVPSLRVTRRQAECSPS